MCMKASRWKTVAIALLCMVIVIQIVILGVKISQNNKVEDDLKMKVSQVHAQSSQMAKMESEMSQILQEEESREEELVRKKQEISHLEESLTSLLEEKQQLQQDKQANEAEIANKQQSIDELNNKIDQLKSELGQ